MKTLCRFLSCASLFLTLLAATSHTQIQTPGGAGETPDFSIQIWGDIVEDFNGRVRSYVELRESVADGETAIVTDDVRAILRAEQKLGRKIVEARAGARRGDIFTPAIGAAFKKALVVVVDPGTWAAIMDDNPGDFTDRVNAAYQKGRPFSTVPANVLLTLPSLPADVQFRFLGRDLILYDTRANLIIDRLPNAIRCKDCEQPR